MNLQTLPRGAAASPSRFAPFAALLLAFVALLATPLFAQAPAGGGIIEGRVFNAASGNALVNARVTVDGSTQSVLTDEGGNYRLNAPAGPATVRVTYLGMETQSASVNVSAGTSVSREFELTLDRGVRPNTAAGETVQLSAFTVAADREMSAQAIAMNEQRNAPNIKNVVSIDEFGDRGAENIGEFLLFLPGVSIETSGSEPTTASIRGFPGNNTGLTVDGAMMASSFGGNTRSVDLREMPMNNISRVEVTKVPTPDMPASGLGGSINLISKSGFEARKPKLTVDAYTMFHSRNGITYDGGHRNQAKETSPDYIQPSFNLSYQHPVNKNFAFTVGAARTFRSKPQDGGTEESDETAEWNLVNLFQRVSQWNSLAQIFTTNQGQFGFDWRISPTDTLSASAQYRAYELYITRSVLRFEYGAGATGGPDFVQGANTGVGLIRMNGDGENIDIVTQTKHYTIKHRHRGSVWNIDGSAYYSTSASDRDDLQEGMFNAPLARIIEVTIRGDDIPSSGGITPTRYSVRNRAGQEVNFLDGANYAIDSVNSQRADYNTQNFGGRLDFGRDFQGKIPLTFKVGAAVDSMVRDQRRFIRVWNFRPNGATTVVGRRAGLFDVFDEGLDADADTFYGQHVRWINNRKLFALYQAQPTWFVEDPATSYQSEVADSRKFKETVSAGYFRVDSRLLNNRLWLVAGVRYERTDNEGWGPLNDITRQYQKNPDGTVFDSNPGIDGIQPVNLPGDALTLRKLRFVDRGAHAKRNYDDFYPSLNASYNLTENLVLRAAYARTIGRPNISFIIPGTTINPDASPPSISVNNSGLRPWTANNYDLSIESYQIKDGFGSFGVFKKDIKNFFGQTFLAVTPELLAEYGIQAGPDFRSYEVSSRSNVGDAQVQGFEFYYRQTLSFLPQWARGFQAFVQFTKLEVDGANNADFTGFNPETFSGGINFARGRLSVKGTVSYLGDMRRGLVAVSTANGIPAETYNYQGKRTRYGLTINYALTRRYQLYASATDIGGFTQNLQRYSPTTPDYAKGQRWQELGFYTNIGVRGTF
ncbi:MAG: TonB-dependent receptor [Verrucomicrobiota bacterium]